MGSVDLFNLQNNLKRNAPTDVMTGASSVQFPVAPQPASITAPQKPSGPMGVISSPEFLYTLANIGAGVSPQGSPAAGLGAAVGNQIQQQQFNIGLQGGPISPILSPEQQSSILQQRNMTKQQEFANQVAEANFKQDAAQ